SRRSHVTALPLAAALTSRMTCVCARLDCRNERIWTCGVGPSHLTAPSPYGTTRSIDFARHSSHAVLVAMPSSPAMAWLRLLSLSQVDRNLRRLSLRQ